MTNVEDHQARRVQISQPEKAERSSLSAPGRWRRFVERPPVVAGAIPLITAGVLLSGTNVEASPSVSPMPSPGGSAASSLPSAPSDRLIELGNVPTEAAEEILNLRSPLTFAIPARENVGVVTAVMSTGDNRAHPDEVFVLLDFVHGNAIAFANPACDESNVQCEELPDLSERFHVQTDDRTGTVRFALTPTSNGTLSGSATVRPRSTGAVRVTGAGKQFEVFEAAQKTAKGETILLTSQSRSGVFRGANQSVDLAASSSAVVACSWATCSVYLTRDQTRRLNDLVDRNSDAIQASAAVGFAVACAATRLGAVASAVCAGVGAVGAGRVTDVLRQAAEGNGCFRIRTNREGFGRTARPALPVLNVYNDGGRNCR